MSPVEQVLSDLIYELGEAEELAKNASGLAMADDNEPLDLACRSILERIATAKAEAQRFISF